MIKFKAITTDGKWVEGDLTHDIFDGTSRVFPIAIRPVKDGRAYLPLEVIPETVCVGVEHDGKWYYENDTVLDIHGNNHVIKFINFSFVTVDPNDDDSEMPFAPYLFEYKITGSIHDHLVKQ